MDKFLEYFERELANLRRQSREFSQRFPRLAGNLQISAEASADPHVEHLIQSIAFLNARISKRLDDDYPDLTQAMLSMTYGHYIRTIPSYSIAQVDYRSAGSSAAATIMTLPRGAEMKSIDTSIPACRFRTAYDLVIAPVRIEAAKFHAVCPVPASVSISHETTSSIQIEIESTGASIDITWG